MACEAGGQVGGPSLLPAGCLTATGLLKPGGFALQGVVGKVWSYLGVRAVEMLLASSGQRPQMLLNILHCTRQPLSLSPSCQRLSQAPNVKSAQAENPGPEESLILSQFPRL